MVCYVLYVWFGFLIICNLFGLLIRLASYVVSVTYLFDIVCDGLFCCLLCIVDFILMVVGLIELCWCSLGCCVWLCFVWFVWFWLCWFVLGYLVYLFGLLVFVIMSYWWFAFGVASLIEVLICDLGFCYLLFRLTGCGCLLVVCTLLYVVYLGVCGLVGEWCLMFDYNSVVWLLELTFVSILMILVYLICLNDAWLIWVFCCL